MSFPTRSATFSRLIRADVTAGLMLIVAAVIAIVWANTPAAGGYAALRDTATHLDLGVTHLDLTIGEWASDGLLAVFFFVVGVELKHEFVAGSLHDARTALTPMVAAAGGVAVPALIFTAIAASTGAEALRGWAVPTATDIAFATAVLGLVAGRLPRALKVFLLTLAVVDDLIAIVIIALFYAEDLAPLWLAVALVPLAAFALLVRRAAPFFIRHRWAPWVILLPLGAIVWVCVHASGIHATVAGVAMGLLVPAVARPATAVPEETSGIEPTDPDERVGTPLTSVLSHRVGPFSSLFCVPIFAFLAAGVTVGGAAGVASALADPVTWGVIVGLVVGKPIGIVLATWAITRTPAASLDPELRFGQLAGMGCLAGIGFTVALLVAELGFGHGSPHAEHATLAVLTASVLSALIGAVWLGVLGRRR